MVVMKVVPVQKGQNLICCFWHFRAVEAAQDLHFSFVLQDATGEALRDKEEDKHRRIMSFSRLRKWAYRNEPGDLIYANIYLNRWVSRAAITLPLMGTVVGGDKNKQIVLCAAASCSCQGGAGSNVWCGQGDQATPTFHWEHLCDWMKIPRSELNLNPTSVPLEASIWRPVASEHCAKARPASLGFKDLRPSLVHPEGAPAWWPPASQEALHVAAKHPGILVSQLKWWHTSKDVSISL